MPAEQPEAAKGVPRADRILQRAPQMQRTLERRVGAGELAQQREEIALADVHFGKLRAVARRLQQGDELVDDALLPLAKTQRLAQALLAQQDVHLRRVALGVGRQAHEPGPRALERGERLGELRERTRSL